MSVDHAATAHLDTPKERALRDDYDEAELEVRELKATIRRLRLLPLPEEYEAMRYWQHRAERAEGILRQSGLSHRLTSA